MKYKTSCEYDESEINLISDIVCWCKHKDIKRQIKDRILPVPVFEWRFKMCPLNKRKHPRDVKIK